MKTAELTGGASSEVEEQAKNDFLISAFIYGFDCVVCICSIMYNCKVRSGNRSNGAVGRDCGEKVGEVLLGPVANAGVLFLAFLIRVGWMTKRYLDNSFSTDAVGERVWNRLVLWLLFLSFGLILLKWIISLRQEGVPYAKRTFVTFAVLLLGISLGLAILSDDMHVRRVSNIFMSFVFLVMSILFFFIGRTLRFRLGNLAQSDFVRSNIRKIKLSSIICTVFFFIRCIAFAYWPLSGNQTLSSEAAQRWYYPWVYYTIPETVNGLTVIYLLVPIGSSGRRGSQSRSLRENSWVIDDSYLEDPGDAFSFVPPRPSAMGSNNNVNTDSL